MLWVGMATAMHDDPAVLRAGEAAELLLYRSMQYAAATESDGLIAREALPRLCPTRGAARAAALVREGLWLEDPQGWRLGELPMRHYVLKESVDAAREAGRRRQREFRERNGRRNGMRNAVTDGEVTQERTPPLRGGRARGTRPRCITHNVDLDTAGVCRSCAADNIAAG